MNIYYSNKGIRVTTYAVYFITRYSLMTTESHGLRHLLLLHGVFRRSTCAPYRAEDFMLVKSKEAILCLFIVKNDCVV